jgi:hypothetical protein
MLLHSHINNQQSEKIVYEMGENTWNHTSEEGPDHYPTYTRNSSSLIARKQITNVSLKMGKGPEWINISQKKTHKRTAGIWKVLNITNNQENVK